MTMEIWTYHDQRLGGIDLTGFDVEAKDGRLGRVDRATRDVSRSYLVIDAGSAMPLGRRVLLPAGFVDTIDLDDRRLAVSVDRDRILNAPEYDPGRPFDESLRNRIGSHYTSPGARQRGRSTGSARQRPAKATSSRQSPSRQRTRSTESDEPTKDDLYKQAKRLNIDGRSKMNKAQLKRAVARRK